MRATQEELIKRLRAIGAVDRCKNGGCIGDHNRVFGVGGMQNAHEAKVEIELVGGERVKYLDGPRDLGIDLILVSLGAVVVDD